MKNKTGFYDVLLEAIKGINETEKKWRQHNEKTKPIRELREFYFSVHNMNIWGNPKKLDIKDIMYILCDESRKDDHVKTQVSNRVREYFRE